MKKTIKSIDGKSLLIGGLLASTIFLALGATSPTDKWDEKQVWEFGELQVGTDRGNGFGKPAWLLSRPNLGDGYSEKLKEYPKGWEVIDVQTMDSRTEQGRATVRRRIK